MASAALPEPIHQVIHVHANPRRRTWQGHTELLVQVPASQTSVGLHCFNLGIQRVTVNGTQAQFTLNSYPKEDLPDPTLDELRRGVTSINSLSEAAYDQYLRLMFREQEPELLISLPQQQQQQQQHEEGEAGDQQQQQRQQAAKQQEQQEPGGVADGADKAWEGEGGAPAAAAGTAGDASTDPSTAPTAAAAATAAGAAKEGEGKASHMQLRISIVFSKPPGEAGDTSLLVRRQCMVTNPLLRRSRALFPCIDSPLYLYTPGALHYLPYTFDLHVTVPPSCMAVCSGTLLQQTCSVAPRPAAQQPPNTAAGGLSAAAAAAEPVVVARTFEYSVGVPVVPAQLSLAVGPFVAVPYGELLASTGGSGPVSLADNLPAITVFTLRPPKAAAGAAGAGVLGPAAAVARQQRGASDGGGGAAAAAAAAGGDGAARGVAGGVLEGLDAREVAQLADTLRPLAVLLGCYSKLLACSLPWSHLQVAVVPDGCMLTPWQAGLGSIFLSRSLLVTDSLLLEPRLSSACALAAATAVQYFGLLLLPRGPEDDWLMAGLAGWLEGQGLKTVAGNNELQYKRWQERLSLAVIDDGEQLGPLSPQVREGDRGFTAAWGRLHGTKELEPLAAAADWKATAVVHMLERRIGEDELRKVLERIVNSAKHAAASTPHTPPTADAAAAVAGAATGAAAAAAAASAAHPSLSGAAPGGSRGAAPTASGGAPTQAASGATAAAAAAPGAKGGRVPAAAAAAAAAAAVGVGRAAAERIMTTAKFLRQMGKKEGFKKEVSGFAARWVHGTGMPVLSAGVSWDARHSQLLLALRQAGGKAVLRGALKGADRPVVPQQAPGGVGGGLVSAPRGTCQLKVLVRELDAVEEHCVQVVADEPLSLHELKVSSKTGEQRRRQQRQAEKAARGSGQRGSHAGRSFEEVDVNEAELQGVPVLWVQVNPGMEWLSVVQLKQPAHWWCLQLQNSKDVVAQAQAVAGLAAQLGAGSSGREVQQQGSRVDDYIITILSQVMRDDGYFCRVRLDAAVALGAASGRLAGEKCMHALLAFTRDRLYDKVTGLLRPNNFSDLGEALINQGLPAALALLRDPQTGFTPGPVLDMLLDLLACNDNSANPVDDGYWLAGLVAGLGQCRLACVADLARVLVEIDRQLAHEAVVTTHNNVLGVACLHAAASLAVTLQHPCSLQVLDQVAALLQAYCQPGSSSRHMKAAAYACLLRVSAGKAEALVRTRTVALFEQQELERWQQQQEQQRLAALAAAAAATGQLLGDMPLGQPFGAAGSAAAGADASILPARPSSAYSAALDAYLPAKSAAAAAAPAADDPATFLDGVLGLALRIVAWETCPVLQAAVLRETLLLIGQLEQQGKLLLDPAAKLPPSISNGSSSIPSSGVSKPPPAAAAAAPAAAVVPAEAAGATGAGVPQPSATEQPAAPAAAGVKEANAGTGIAQPSQAGGDAPGAAMAAAAAAPVDPAAAAAAPANPAAAAAGGSSEQQQQQQPDCSVVPMAVDTVAVLSSPAATAYEPAAAAAGAYPPAAAHTAAAVAAAATFVPVSLEVLLALHQLMWRHGEPTVRQLAFMLLQKLAGQPATLYRAREEEEEEEGEAQAGPAATLTAGGAVTHPGSKQQTGAAGAARPAHSGGGSLSGRTGAMGAPSARPAASGGVSFQTGTAATGKKLRFKLGQKAGGASPAVTGSSPATGAAAAADKQQQQQQAQTQPFAVPAPPVPPASDQQQQQGAAPPPAAAAVTTPQGDPTSAVAAAAAPGQRPSPSPAPAGPPQSAPQKAAPPPAAGAAAPAAAAAGAPGAAAPAAAVAAAAAAAAAAAPTGGIIRGKPLHKLRRATPSHTPPPPGVTPGAAAAAAPAAGAPTAQGLKRPASAAADAAPGAGAQQQQQPVPPGAAEQQAAKRARQQHGAAAPGLAGTGVPAAAAAAPAASASMAPSASTGTAVSTKLKFKLPGKIKLPGKPKEGGGG